MPLSPHHIRKVAEMKAAVTRLLAKLPPSFKNDPDVKKLAPIRDVGELTIARLTNPGLSHAGFSMDHEFSRATINELWATGLEDVRRSKASIGAMQPTQIGCIARLYDLPPGVAAGAPPESKAAPARAQQPKPSPRRRSRAARSRRSTRVEQAPRSKRLRKLAKR
jgi:NTE family protein